MRYPLIDALRGLALLGILQINMQAWVVGLSPFSSVLQPGSSALDHLVWLTTSFFITAKFYPIFAFLFGYGFAMQWSSLGERGLDARRFLTRRYLFLLALGVVHGSLLFFGDILTMYALAGFVLLASATFDLTGLRWLLRVWLGLALLVIDLIAVTAFQPPQPVVLVAYDPVRRAMDYFYLQVLQIPLFLPQVMVFFLCGVYAARLGLLQHPGAHLRTWRRLLRLGLVAGVPISFSFTLLKWLPVGMDVSDPWVEAASALTNQLCALMSPAIVAGFVLLGLNLRRDSWLSALYRWLANAGRLGLSNYLLQSLLMLILLGWAGLGLRLGAAQLAGLGLVIGVLQLAGSTLYLRYFDSGPFEWLWRRFTYAPGTG